VLTEGLYKWGFYLVVKKDVRVKALEAAEEKQEEEQKKKRGADVATRKRQRDEEERREKERKKKCIEEARKQQTRPMERKHANNVKEARLEAHVSRSYIVYVYQVFLNMIYIC